MDKPFTVINTEKKIETEIPEYQRRMIEVLDNIDERCWSKGKGYVAPNFPLFTEGTSGVDDGVYYFGGAPNTGKSAVMMNLAYDLVNNESNNMFGIYFSLDDSLLETVPRIVAMMEKIKIDVIKRPTKYDSERELIRRRKNGINRLKDASRNMVVYDSTGAPHIEEMHKVIKEHKMMLAEAGREDAKFVIVIDSFHDLNSKDNKFSGNNEKSDYFSAWVKNIVRDFDAIVMCSAHLRKLNGFRRPIYDDIKESGTIAYDAQLIVLCHNEVGLKGERADVFYNRDGVIEKQPVVEMHFAKNKLGSFKGRIFTEFIPDYSNVAECSYEACRHYNAQIFQA